MKIVNAYSRFCKLCSIYSIVLKKATNL